MPPDEEGASRPPRAYPIPDWRRGVYLLKYDEQKELAAALLARPRLGAQGREAFAKAYPHAAPVTIHTAAHHVFEDGPTGVVAWLADAELFLRDPVNHKMERGVVYEVLYHLYNWMTFEELVPSGREYVLTLIKDLREHVKEGDLEALEHDFKVLEEAIDGNRDYPNYQ